MGLYLCACVCVYGGKSEKCAVISDFGLISIAVRGRNVYFSFESKTNHHRKVRECRSEVFGRRTSESLNRASDTCPWEVIEKGSGFTASRSGVLFSYEIRERSFSAKGVHTNVVFKRECCERRQNLS